MQVSLVFYLVLILDQLLLIMLKIRKVTLELLNFTQVKVLLINLAAFVVFHFRHSVRAIFASQVAGSH